MKKRLALEAFLTFVIEALIPDLKRMISNIFTLKSKTITILLGTFVPLFFSHAVAYSVCPEITEGSMSFYKRVRGNLLYFFIFLWALLCECALWYCFYLAIINNLDATKTLGSRVLFIVTVALLIFCGRMLGINVAYDGLLKSRRKSS